MDRNELIVLYRQCGMTYQAIADKFGFTKERGRQIIAKHQRIAESHKCRADLEAKAAADEMRFWRCEPRTLDVQWLRFLADK